MTIQQIIDKGVPDHVVADSIIYLWFYMTGAEQEKNEKRAAFKTRFQLYDIKTNYIDLLSLLQDQTSATILWAAETLRDFLPRDMQEEYLDEYISHGVSSGTLWVQEFHILQAISKLFGIEWPELKGKIEKLSGKELVKVVSRQSPPGTMITSDQAEAAIIRLRSKLNLGEQKFIRIVSPRSEPEASPPRPNPQSPPSPHKPRGQTPPKQPTAPNPKVGSRTKEDKTVIIVLILFAFFTIAYFVNDSSSWTSQSVSPTTGTTNISPQSGHSFSTRERSSSSSGSQARQSQTTLTEGRRSINRYAFNRNPVDLYNSTLNPVANLKAGSIYWVVSESVNMLTLETEHGRYTAFKRFFDDYQDIQFTSSFSGNTIYSREHVPLRSSLSYASKTESLLPVNRAVRMLRETATSVEIQVNDQIFWANKSLFQDHPPNHALTQNPPSRRSMPDESTTLQGMPEFIYQFVDIKFDGAARTHPRVTASPVHQLREGDRVLVINKVPNSRFYRILISGQEYFVSELILDIDN